MIPVSMSRKTRSFGQLVSYMDSEKSDRMYDLHHNCLARGQADIAQAFLQNSQHLRKRKNGNILYHEIISITLEDGVELKYAKDCLRDIAEEYIAKRCPQNMVYGTLHEDHTDHLHYHLMVSANPLGEQNRLSLRKGAFEQIKHDLEAHVLATYPELKQRPVNTLSAKEKGISRKASAQKRRTGKLERQEAVRDTILKAMMHCENVEAFKAKLADQGFEFYTRGKHVGVKVSHNDGKQASYRFATLGIHESYNEFVQVMDGLNMAQETPEEPSVDQEKELKNDQKMKENRPSGGSADDVKAEDAGGQQANDAEMMKEAETEGMKTDPAPQEAEIEPPSFYEEMRDRRKRKREKQEQKYSKRRGKPRR